jgi:glutamine amidotransferase
MCRWFAYISPVEPCLLSDVLITPANSISKQCSEHYLPKLLPHDNNRDLDHTSDELLRMRNSLLNMDGLGIACASRLLVFDYQLTKISRVHRGLFIIR